jgi:3alpha(or 20beta)-hydroxysteroid dehydrogenase
MNRKADPVEVSSLVVYLASDESSFITGTEIVVDGGELAGHGPLGTL